MLHLHAGQALVIVAASGHNGRAADALPAAERRQCLIRHRQALDGKFLMDSHEIAFARVQ